MPTFAMNQLSKSNYIYLPATSYKIPSKQTACISVVFVYLFPHLAQFLFLPGSILFEINLKLAFDEIIKVFQLSIYILVFIVCTHCLKIHNSVKIINDFLNAFTSCSSFPLKCKMLFFLFEFILDQRTNVVKKPIQVQLLEMTCKHFKNRAHFSVLGDEHFLKLEKYPNLGLVRILCQ